MQHLNRSPIPIQHRSQKIMRIKKLNSNIWELFLLLKGIQKMNLRSFFSQYFLKSLNIIKENNFEAFYKIQLWLNKIQTKLYNAIQILSLYYNDSSLSLPLQPFLVMQRFLPTPFFYILSHYSNDSNSTLSSLLDPFTLWQRFLPLFTNRSSPSTTMSPPPPYFQIFSLYNNDSSRALLTSRSSPSTAMYLLFYCQIFSLYCNVSPFLLLHVLLLPPLQCIPLLTAISFHFTATSSPPLH